MSAEIANDCDVAIVGYGPTGMTLAALLGQMGRRVIVLERYDGLYNLPRAACFDDEIMRLFQKLGVTQEVSTGIVAQHDYDWINPAGETLVQIEYADPAPCGWAALYMMYQPHIETVLDRLDKSLPSVSVHQGVTVTALEQDGDGVTLIGSRVNGEAITVRAKFAVGADGGSGFMRQALRTTVDDYGFQENWLVCDFEMKRQVPGLPMFRQVCDPAQPTSIVRIGPHHHRFSFMLNPGETTELATRADRVWARVAPYLAQDDADLIRVANYVFRSRVAQRWRDGRVFLAGDAAHEMPPFLAQGMCSGMRDSHNLSWKLDLVLRGRANESLLDTYQPEREPHVRFITEKAIELGRVQTIRDPALARERDERLLARRRDNQAPEKLRYPALSAGLVGNGGGLFPQGKIGSETQTLLFDHAAGAGWMLVAMGRDALDGIDAETISGFAAIGGRPVVIGPADALRDTDGIYSGWFAEHRCTAAIVRPDWNVYGTASTAAELTNLLRDLRDALDAPSEQARSIESTGRDWARTLTGVV